MDEEIFNYLVKFSKQIVDDFDNYGEVLQADENGEYSKNSAIMRLKTVLQSFDKNHPIEK